MLRVACAWDKKSCTWTHLDDRQPTGLYALCLHDWKTSLESPQVVVECFHYSKSEDSWLQILLKHSSFSYHCRHIATSNRERVWKMALAKRWRRTIGRKMLKMGEIIDTAVELALNWLSLSFPVYLVARLLGKPKTRANSAANTTKTKATDAHPRPWVYVQRCASNLKTARIMKVHLLHQTGWTA